MSRSRAWLSLCRIEETVQCLDGRVVCRCGGAYEPQEPEVYLGRSEAWELRMIRRRSSIRSMPYLRCRSSTAKVEVAHHQADRVECDRFDVGVAKAVQRRRDRFDVHFVSHA